MEAAHITWRPLGRLLVEQGLLTSDELERALAEQQVTGQRLGETIVKLGFVSGPELASALAAQYGIELTTESGFGTGLRSEIQRRHESDRKRVVQLVPDVEADADPEPEAEAEIFELVAAEPEHDTGEAALLAQLEEQWAKLAAAEEALAERERELTDLTEGRERDFGELSAGRDRELAESAEREQALKEQLEDRERELADHAERDHQLAELTQNHERELAERAEHERGLMERAEKLERELDELTERERQLTELAESRGHELAELAESRDREHAERTERERELAELTERHQSDLRQLEDLNERLREEAEPEEPAPVTPANHLVFVQLDERYELISRDGPPPAQSTPLSLPDVDEGMFVVAGRRSSPLPGDERPCVFVQRG